MTVWFVPKDAAAKSVGADEVAAALLARGDEVVRTGSRGLLWLEPLVESAEDRQGSRIGWANVTVDDIAAGLLDERHSAYLGDVAAMEFLTRDRKSVV